LFDPMPTYWHVLAVSSVPAGNLLVWIHLRHGVPRGPAWIAFVNGAAIAVAGFYALLFLPLMPFALVGILFAVGLLPLAPFAALLCALQLRLAFSARYGGRPSIRPLLGGLAVGLALLLALDAQAAATRLGIQWAASSVPSERQRGVTLLQTVG